MTNTESVRRRVAAIPRDSIKRVSLPHRTMQSMLNRITINCINSKNSRDSKHRPSAHNRPITHASAAPAKYPHFLLAAALCRQFIDFTRDHRESCDLPHCHISFSWAEITSSMLVYLLTLTLFMIQLLFISK